MLRQRPSALIRSPSPKHASLAHQGSVPVRGLNVAHDHHLMAIAFNDHVICSTRSKPVANAKLIHLAVQHSSGRRGVHSTALSHPDLPSAQLYFCFQPYLPPRCNAVPPPRIHSVYSQRHAALQTIKLRQEPRH